MGVGVGVEEMLYCHSCRVCACLVVGVEEEMLYFHACSSVCACLVVEVGVE